MQKLLVYHRRIMSYQIVIHKQFKACEQVFTQPDQREPAHGRQCRPAINRRGATANRGFDPVAAGLDEAVEHLLRRGSGAFNPTQRSEEHTSELQSRGHLVCRLLLEKKKPSITPS